MIFTVETASRFLERYIAQIPPALREINRKYLNSPVPREEIARAEGLLLGRLLRSFNETAPVSPPTRFVLGGRQFAVRWMRALCDDFCGDRFGAFGEPVSLRVYADPQVLPQGMHTVADWNFMDAALPAYLGYGYGSVFNGILFLSGLQSDLAQRYTYLFQRPEGKVDAREGEEILRVSGRLLVEKFGRYVPALRRNFQRTWIEVLLAGCASYALTQGLRSMAFQQFSLTEEELRPGAPVFRVSRGLPAKIPSASIQVLTPERTYMYSIMETWAVRKFLGA
jgi:hypothetical protein